MRYYLIYSLIINQKLIKFSKLIRELVGKIYFFSSKETNKNIKLLVRYNDIYKIGLNGTLLKILHLFFYSGYNQNNNFFIFLTLSLNDFYNRICNLKYISSHLIILYLEKIEIKIIKNLKKLKAYVPFQYTSRVLINCLKDIMRFYPISGMDDFIRFIQLFIINNNSKNIRVFFKKIKFHQLFDTFIFTGYVIKRKACISDTLIRSKSIFNAKILILDNTINNPLLFILTTINKVTYNPFLYVDLELYNTLKLLNYYYSTGVDLILSECEISEISKQFCVNSNIRWVDNISIKELKILSSSIETNQITNISRFFNLVYGKIALFEKININHNDYFFFINTPLSTNIYTLVSNNLSYINWEYEKEILQQIVKILKYLKKNQNVVPGFNHCELFNSINLKNDLSFDCPFQYSINYFFSKTLEVFYNHICFIRGYNPKVILDIMNTINVNDKTIYIFNFIEGSFNEFNINSHMEPFLLKVNYYKSLLQFLKILFIVSI